MTRRFSRSAAFAVIPLLIELTGHGLAAQALDAPRYRPRDAATRAAHMVDSIARLDASVGGVRRVVVDTLSAGAIWLEFEPAALARALRAPTPEAAAATFVTSHGPKVLGIASAETELRLVKSHTAGNLTHLRYEQVSAGYAVLGGQLAVHVARVPGGYTIQSVNGWLVPNVAAPAAPSLTRRQAEVAALSVGSGTIAWGEADTAPVVVPHEEATRLAYLVPVMDSVNGAVIRFVDAQTGIVFGQARATDTFSPSNSVRAERNSGRQPVRPVAAERLERHASVGYMSTQGMDWQGITRPFVVWFNGAAYELRDNSHLGAYEISIYSFDPINPENGCEPNARPIISSPTLGWPVDDFRKGEVSAVHNLGETVTYFKTKFDRNGMRGLTPAGYTIACVHLPYALYYFRGSYQYPNWSIEFTSSGVTNDSTDGPAGAAPDLVTHEFMHGVSDWELGGTGFVSPEQHFESKALDEALSDYFGSRQSNVTCSAQEVWKSVPCLDISTTLYRRRINSSLTVSQRNAGCDSDDYHCLGTAFASALWGATQALPPAGDDEVDQATYHGLYDAYMIPVTPFVHGREAIVRAAKNRERDNSSLYPIVSQLELEFYNRGIGLFPVGTYLSESVCGQWQLFVTQWPVGTQGAVSQDFALRFESGASLNEDGGVGSPAYGQDLGTYDSSTLPGSFTPAQLGGHTGSDGHYHSMRLRFTAASGTVGYLDYYAGHGPYCGQFVVTATAPSLVTVKTTYQLTGSASSSATGWLWEQSVNGGAYGFWSNQQNSSFLAYSGTYTLGWRLSATGTYYGTPDTAWTTTQVCIPFNPSCYQLRADQEPAPLDSAIGRTGSKVAGDHFGSGLWIALPDGAAKRLIRMYAFSGRHDSSTTAVPWPNILERDGGDWSYATPSGALTLATRRHPGGENRTLLQVSGRLAGRGTRAVALGLAADPDLDEPADDALGFDPDLGLVWVRDGLTGRHVGYLALAGTPTARVQQFGAGLDEAPESAAKALDLMKAPTRIAAGEVADVRFLLTGPDMAIRGDGGFEATFAILLATSEEALLDLARATRRDAAALVAGIPGQPLNQVVDAFALRQSLGASSLAASATGSGGGQSSIARLQADGLTALDYNVPTGQAVGVRIRLYNSRGQLVRTLVDQQVSGGSYHLEWDRLNERGERVSPGVYVAVMEAGGFRATRKLVVTR